ncbi:hypothetical protein OsJ_29672 [Oryza sativa Japonica Group]|uniref:Uncharacterized protein n=1 Tax=Oryza sativa subsp. japonica TaxID=39947 RepID=A3BZP5_ORYSJ|nr:hypothetical protein OsJ_29672 [Oryza sativa Japonica Group]
MGLKGFVEGGAACVVAGSCTHPLDLIKVRMQLHGEGPPAPALAFPGCCAHHHHHHHLLQQQPPRMPGPIAVCAQILRAEGPTGLLSGVSATMLRQTLYSTTCMGLYDTLKRRWERDDGGGGGPLPLHRKVAAGLFSGGVGAAVGNPADVAMVRMQADGRLPAAQRRNYRSVADAIVRMARDEGVCSLWRGSPFTVKRAMIVAASQLATYDQAKEAILARRGPGRRRARHARRGRPRRRPRGRVGVHPRRRRQDQGHEHEGGGRRAVALLRCARLPDQDRAFGGGDGAVQGVRPDGDEAGALHHRPLRDPRAGSEAVEGRRLLSF